MSEPDALQKRRGLLLEQIGKAADEIKQIDERSGPEQTPLFLMKPKCQKRPITQIANGNAI